MKSARAKRAKLSFFIVKYANFHRRGRRRRDSLRSLFFPGGDAGRVDADMRACLACLARRATIPTMRPPICLLFTPARLYLHYYII